MLLSSIRSFSTLIALAAAAIVLTGCSADSNSVTGPSSSNGNSMTGSGGSALTLTASSSFVPANGSTTITVTMRQGNGSAEADGTEVTLSTDIGELDPKKVKIRSGEAISVYRAGSTPGTAKISASSFGGSGSLSLPIGSAAPGGVAIALSKSVLPLGGGDVDVVATVTAPNGDKAIGLLVKFSTSAGSLSVTEVVSGDGGDARTTLKTTESATVRATVTSFDASASVRVQRPVTIHLTFAPESPMTDEATKIATSVTTDGQDVEGSLVLALGDGLTKDVGTINGLGTASYSWDDVGSYDVTAVFKDLDGFETRETKTVTVRERPAPPPPPAPAPPSNPFPFLNIDPLGTVGPNDVDPTTFSWADAEILDFNEGDIENWPITAQPTEVTAFNPTITFRVADDYERWLDEAGFGDPTSPTGASSWGNYWIVVKYQGRTFISTFHWGWRPDGERDVIREEFRNTFQGRQPMSSWPGPKDGQIIGLFVSTRARNSSPPNGVRERSPIVFVRYNTGEVVGIVP